MNGGKVKRILIPAIMATLGALATLAPWLSMSILSLDAELGAALGASPWNMSEILNGIGSFVGGDMQLYAILGTVYVALMTLFILLEFLSDASKLLDWNLHKSTGVFDIFPIIGYAMELLLAIALVILTFVLKNELGFGPSFTPWMLLAIVVSIGGIVVKLMSKGEVETTPRLNAIRTGGSGGSGTVIMRQAPGCVNAIAANSNFTQRYQGYRPFGKAQFSYDSRAQNVRMGDVLFSGGAYPFIVANNYQQVGFHSEANGTDDQAFANVQKAQSVMVAGCWGEWYLCKHNNNYGWIKAKYLVQPQR